MTTGVHTKPMPSNGVKGLFACGSAYPLFRSDRGQFWRPFFPFKRSCVGGRDYQEGRRSQTDAVGADEGICYLPCFYFKIN